MKTFSVPLLQTLLCLPPHLQQDSHSYNVLHPPIPQHSPSSQCFNSPGMVKPPDLCIGLYPVPGTLPHLSPELPLLLQATFSVTSSTIPIESCSHLSVIYLFISNPSWLPEADPCFLQSLSPDSASKVLNTITKGSLVPLNLASWEELALLSLSSGIQISEEPHPFTLVTCPARGKGHPAGVYLCAPTPWIREPSMGRGKGFGLSRAPVPK